jgi:murein DD-endopeptidase MepM/ murein hydrolase activator NlpD
LTALSRRPQATPSPRLVAGKMLRDGEERLRGSASDLGGAALALFTDLIPAVAAAFFGPRGLRLLLNLATALLVVSLPFTVAGFGGQTTAQVDEPLAAASISSINIDDGASRVATTARGIIAGSRSPVTVAAEDVRPVINYAVEGGDNLGAIAQHFQIDIDDLAFANGIDDESETLRVGQSLLIPPGLGALYFVKDGDTIAGVAKKFKVEQAAIMSYNRLYFEPEHFAPGQLIFVPGGEVPAMKRITAPRSIPIPGQLPARTGQLSWPVNGVLTQSFWWGHTGVDLAAPYGTPIKSADDGVVVATGWVAVGGLRVCVQHSGGMQTCYYHTSAVYVTPGQTVARGQVLAAIGMTGVTTGPHVHWEVKINGAFVNPLAY